MHSLAGGSLPSWDLDHAPSVPAVQIAVPEAVKLSSRRSGWSLGDVEALFVAGGEMWLITPASAVGHGRTMNHLFAAEMKAATDGKIFLDPVEIAWPPQDAKKNNRPPAHRSSRPAMLPTGRGSPRSGLEPRPTDWRVSTRQAAVGPPAGTPRATVSPPTPLRGFPVAAAAPSESFCWSVARAGARIMPDGTRKPDRPTYVWTLNPQTREVKLLLDGNKLNEPLLCPPAAMTRDGKSFLLEFLGRGSYDLDVKDIHSFRPSDIGGWAHDLVCDETGQLRLLQVSGDAGPDEMSLETLEPLPTSAGRSGGSYSVFPLAETRQVFGRVWWRDGDRIRLSGRWPAVYGEFARGRGQHFWIGFSSAGGHSGTSHWLVAYRPAPARAENWAAEDQWVGPFRVPDNGSITRMAPRGEESLLLTTNQGMYLVDCRQAIEQAVRQRRTCSTEQWRSQYEKRLLAAGWTEALPLLLESQKWDQAVQLLEAQRNRLRSTTAGFSTTETHLNLWHAALACPQGRTDRHIRLYGQVAERAATNRDRPAEVFASMNQVILLFHAARFQEMLDLCRSVNRRFPQIAPQRDDERLSWYMRKARKKIVAGSPAGPRPAPPRAATPAR